MKPHIYLLLFVYVCSSAVIEEGTVYSGIIDQYASQKIKYTSTGGQKQIHYYQCTGSADLTIVDDAKQIDVESFKAEVNKKTECTDDTPKVECFAAPCDVNSCSNYPHATCVNNYCGGCNAVYSVQGEEVECDTYSDPDLNKGAAPNWSVGTYNEGNFTFWLLGKMSENDDINSYKIYLDNNSNAQYIVVAQDSEIVSKAVSNSSVTLAWLEPTTVFTNIAKYCIFHKALPLNQKLNGDWVACGHEVQSGAQSSLCTTASSTEIQGLATNSSHYFWVVVYGENNSTTAYPFTRVDLVETYSGSGALGLHLILLSIALLLWS